MEPNISYNYQNPGNADYTPSQLRVRKTLKILGICVVVAGIVVGGLFAYQDSKFHLVSTSPKTDNVATVAPYIQLDFNRPLATKGIALHADPSIISSYSINGTVLTINFTTTILLNTKTTYTLTVESISDTKGDKLANKTVSFTPKSVDFNSLSKDQQQAILKQQSDRPTSVNNTTYLGTDDLTNTGVTFTQVSDLEQAIYNFATSTKKTIQRATFSNAQPVWQDPNNPTTNQEVSFNVSLDASSYTAKLVSPDLTSAQLFLYDTKTGTLVYQSALIDTTKS